MVDVEYETKNIFFIYAQQGEKSNIGAIETNDKVKKVKEIYKENLGIQVQSLYNIEIRKQKDENRLIISLIDYNGECYNSLIHFTKNEIFGEEDEEDALILFKLMFYPYEKKESNILGQFTLHYEEQFYIFEKYFTEKKNDKLKINLYASTISQYLLKDNLNYKFVINLFFKLYDEREMNSYPQLKKVLKYYFDNIKKILKNCEVSSSESIKVDKEKLNMLNETEEIRKKLIKITNAKEENIDIFLSYYYIYFEKKKFVQFINNEKYKENLIITLNANRDIFNDFTIDVLSPELIDEAEETAQLVPLMQLYPNIVECFKLLTNYTIFLKFISLKELNRKGINLMLIHTPKKNDNIDLLNKYFKEVYDLFKAERAYPLIIKENFFIEYYKTFQGDEDFHKNSIIIEMLKLYNTKIYPKIKTEEIFNLHLVRGFSLIKKKKLKNLDLIEFIKGFSDNIKESKELIVAFKDGIEFKEKDYDFTNKFLTDDRFELKEFLGYTNYYEVMEKIFSKFIIPKDLLVLKDWRLDENTPHELIKIFMLTLKRIWIKNPENNMYGLDKLIAMEFSKASIYLDSSEFYPIINELEDKIDKEKLMAIYSVILLKEFPITEKFKTHIIKYIESYDEFTPRYIWYLMSTQPDQTSKIDFLRTYIDYDTGGDIFAVKYYDFVNYPRKIDERIILFTNLCNYNYIPDYFEDSLYYKNSIKAKYDLEKNTFKDALIMRTNILKINELIEQFFMAKTEYNYFMVLINFGEKVDIATKYYDSLKYVKNYWETFFPNEKANELINLNEAIIKFEKMKLEECMEESAKDNTYVNFLDEAKEGRQLQGSKIFMEIYNKLNNLKNNDVERYHISLSKFETLAKLGERCDLNILDDELKDTIINAIYQNIDLLNEELRFIQNYFKYEVKKDNNKFDIKLIRNNILELVKKKQEQNGDYIIDLDKLYKEDEQINKNGGNKSLNNDPIVVAEKLSKEEMLKKKQEIRNIYELIIYNSKIVDNTHANLVQEKNDFNKFYELVFTFYQKLFKGIGLSKLSLKEIYQEIISSSKKIFYLAKNLQIFDNFKNDGDKFEQTHIFELNFILKMLERYQLMEKMNYINTFSAFKELYQNFQDNNFSCQSINQLLDFLKEKISKFFSNYIFGEIFLYEIIKNKEKRELLTFILDSKYSYIYGDLLPVMDIIFDNEIKDKLRFDRKVEINDLEFNSAEFQHINEICKNNKDNFGEMLLFYFENKIMNELDNIIKKGERNIFIDENILEGLIKYLDFLKDNINNNNKILLLLYAIAFVKCFLYELINIMQKTEDPLKDIKYLFNNILKINDANPVRTSIKMYIIKLIFNNCGNFSNFAGINFKQKYFITEDIEKYIGPRINKSYGFDFLFIPLRLDTQEEIYNSILKKFFQDKQIFEITSDNEINEIIKYNVDIFYCMLANFDFSNYSDKGYFGLDDYKNTKKNYSKKINEEEIDCLKNKETLKKLFLYLINFGNTKVYKEFDVFTYDQLLSFLISARFVIKTIYSEDENNLFYNLLLNANNTINDNQDFFKKYYLKDFDVHITDKRKISCLTYKIINFVILSHIYFGYQLKLIKFDDIESILELNKLEKKEDKNISDYLLEKIFNEFDFIKNTLLPLLGINNVIIFMNLLYKELYEKIIAIENNISEENIKKYEKELIDTTINNVIFNYKEEVINYNKYEDIINSNESDGNNITESDTKNNNTNDLIDIILERDKFYNDKIFIKKKYPLLPYFTNTNYCVLNDDFKNQYLYYYNDSSNYPFISSFLTGENIFDIIDYLPKLNEFSNKVYNKINMRYTKEETNSKTIKEIFKNELNGDINTYNDFIEKNKDLFGENKIIDNNKKIFEIINIDGSIINSVYKVIIKMYNEFLSGMKIGNNKELIDKVIIQEARENDYNFNYILNDEKKITIQEKLNELILLYSKRERKVNDNLNVYDGGKINYNFEIIENKLEDLFIFGKKLFLENPKVFIFAEEIFKPVENIIKTFENKYSPKINNDSKGKIDDYLKNISDKDSLNLFYEIYFILKYICQENFDLKIREEDNNSLNHIIKYLELKSYSLPELKKVKDSLKEYLLLNNLLFFYETLEIKVFDSFTTIFRKKINDDVVVIKDENIINDIEKTLENNNIIKLERIVKAMKKFILRNILYEDEYLFKLNHLINGKNVWDIDIAIFGTNEFKAESKKLNDLDKDNNVIKYIYCDIFNIKYKEIENNEEPDDPDEDL